MHTIEKSVEVDVPVSTAYAVWTRFERFPKFMPDVNEIRQESDRHLYWHTTVWGQNEEWAAEITEQIPDKRIAWKSIGGASHAGVVTFHRLSDDRACVIVQMTYEANTWAEKVGHALGIMKRHLEMNLEGFKQYAEREGGGVHAWRGEIRSPDDRRAEG